jgi:uncharacterized RDD family membrane protein YckC
MQYSTPDFKQESSAIFEDASLGRRFLAFLLDGLILCVPMAIGGALLPVVGALLVWFFWVPILEASELKGTLGKFLVGIQVVDAMGRRLSLPSAVLRNIMKFVSSVLLFIGFFFALFSRRKQTLHDLVAETFVVYGRSQVSVIDAWSKEVGELFSGGALKSSAPPEVELPPRVPEAGNWVSELERIEQLRAKGALSEEEFQLAKKKILGENEVN